MIAEGRVLFFGMALQRGYGEGVLSSITYFPGGRFIIAGLLSRPHSYYKVGGIVVPRCLFFGDVIYVSRPVHLPPSAIPTRFARPTA